MAKKTFNAALAEMQYIELAAKRTKYEVDARERIIYVPYFENIIALDDLVVEHLVKHKGCRIELTLDRESPEKEMFEPELHDRIVRPEEVKIYAYNKGDVFIIVNSGNAIIELDRVEKGINGGLNYWFKYINRQLPEFKMYESEIKRLLSFQLWRVGT